jgi:uncharacterized protein (TIGR02246 family)
MQSKDAAAVAAAFTDDAIWTLPTGATRRGRAEIDPAAKAFTDSYESMTISSTTIDKLVVISDSEALTFSTILYTQTTKGAAPEARRNPFADYWKKGADGTWRVAYEINADGSAAEAPATP